MVLNTCGNFNKRLLKKCGLLDKTCKYVGVIFTDEMFLDRIQPLVKRIEKDRRYRDKEVELQFHPGGIKKGEYFLDEQFEEWFESSNREGEAKTLKCLKVNQNAE